MAACLRESMEGSLGECNMTSVEGVRPMVSNWVGSREMESGTFQVRALASTFRTLPVFKGAGVGCTCPLVVMVYTHNM